MATYSIITGSGFTGNAQYVTGSIYEGISLGTLTSGSKYDISFDYISSAPLNVYSSDYSDKFIVTQYPSTIAINTGSIKSWSGEFLAVYDKENFLGLGSDGWFAVDKLRVKPIPNLVTNGTFDGDSGWGKDAGWAIDTTNKYAVATTANGNLYQANKVIAGKRYRVSYQVVSYTGGQIRPRLGETAGTGRTSTGSYSDDIVAGSSGNSFEMNAIGFTGVIDNVHFYEIPEWTASGNHICDISTLDKSGTTGTQSLKVTASGAGVSVTECVTNGNCATYSGTSPSQLATGWQKYSNDPTDTATIVTGNGFSGNAQRIEDTSGNGRIGISFPIAATSGLKYKATITYRASHSFYFYASGIGTSISTANIPANTGNAITITVDVTPDYTNFMGAGFNADANKIGAWIEISNVSVKEVLGEVSLPSANIESCVATKKYTLEGFARLDASSLSYGVTNKVKDGDFSAYTYWTRSNPTDFDVTGGVAVKSGNPSGVIYQGTSAGVTYTAGKVYKVILTVSGLTGGVTVDVNGSTSTVYLTTEGTHTIYITAGTNTALGLRIIGGTNTLFIIDNVSSFEADMVNITAQLGTKSVTSSALSIVAGTFTKFVLNFEATASEVNQDLKLWLSGAGSVFVDKLSLTQRYDVVYIPMNKVNDISGYYTIFGKYIGTTGGFNGDYLWYDNTTGKLQYFVSDGSGISSGRSILTTNGLTPATWNKITVVSKFDEIKIYRNGVELASSTLTNQFGKVIVNQALGVGGFTVGTLYSFKGQISHLQIIRFENISQSTFNSALTGLQYPTGGGAEEVLRLTWNNIAGTTAYNESTYGAIASTNAVGFGTKNAATNIVTVKDYLYQKDKLIQPTEVSRPVYTSGSYFQFDGTNDFLYHTGSLGIVKEFYIKFKPDVVNTNMGLVNFNATSSLFLSSSNIAFMSGSTFSTMSIYNSSLIPTSSVTNSDWNILHCSDSTGTLANLFKIGVAGTTYYDGAVQRYLSYDRQLSDNDRIRILRNLSF